MSNYMNFSTDKVDAFLLLLDKSGSMDDEVDKMRAGLQMYKESFEKFAYANSMAVSICRFGSNFRPDEFRHVNDLDINYSTGGATALYYSICQAAKHLKRYIAEVTETKNIVPRATFIVFSDGEPCEDPGNEIDAKEIIQDLNYAGITTVFVAFGKSITSEFGKRLGFLSTIDVTDRSALTTFMGVELSKSCKEQSKSMKSLGANFFSQAVGTKNSEAFSQSAAQALEDDSWIDDI